MKLEDFNPYYYLATVVSVYDGDSLTLDIELGFDFVMRNQKVRSYGIDTPELRGVERMQGLFVKHLVSTLLPEGERILIESHKDKRGKYGRLLVTIYLADGTNLNQYLLDNGYAVEFVI